MNHPIMLNPGAKKRNVRVSILVLVDVPLEFDGVDDLVGVVMKFQSLF